MSYNYSNFVYDSSDEYYEDEEYYEEEKYFKDEEHCEEKNFYDFYINAPDGHYFQDHYFEEEEYYDYEDYNAEEYYDYEDYDDYDDLEYYDYEDYNAEEYYDYDDYYDLEYYDYEDYDDEEYCFYDEGEEDEDYYYSFEEYTENLELKAPLAFNKMENSEKRRGKKRTKAEADQSQGPSTDDIYESIETEESDANLSVRGLPCVEWTDAQYVSEVTNVSYYIVENIIKLFKADNTIPFIARYRKNITGGLEPEQLRIIKESFERAKLIRHRANTILTTIDKLGKWTPDVYAIVKSTKSLNDLEHIYSMFKPPLKRALSERARELGLGSITEDILQGQRVADLSSFIDVNREGLKTVKEIKEGIIHIIADLISKHKTMFEKIRELRKTTIIQIETSPGKAAKEENVKAEKAVKAEKKIKVERKNFDASKYKIYYDFKSHENNIKPHQILAINRGESQKFLSVKIAIPNFFEQSLKNHVLTLYAKAISTSHTHSTLIKEAFDYAYKKSIKPAIIRRFRNEMNEKAETASMEVFSMNLKQLILTPPFRGKPVLGIDPGFFHGCKLAVVSENGEVLQTKTIYPHSKPGSFKESVNTLASLVKTYNCTSIALGNGTACRETEVFLANLIKSKTFAPLNVSYTIINEAGASIYSCSEEAKKEFPNLDPNLISAASIARRLQDPMAELVKVEPKHLGVGMYQHDLPEKRLNQTLNEVVTDAVSFVGVDVNTASHCLLKKVAGLNVTRATNIIEWRKKNGPFTNREQFLQVKGIGNKTYEQCAGFIRILPETALVSGSKSKSKKPLNYLDQTWIHPEAYKIATEFLKLCKCRIEDLGTESFIKAVTAFGNQGYSIIAQQLKTNEDTVKIIVTGLAASKGYDIRLKGDKPLFRSSLTGINDLSPGVTLRGVVRNVTHFGVFADVGVCRDGLIPSRYMKGQSLSIGQAIEVKVLTVEKEKNKFSIELVKTL